MKATATHSSAGMPWPPSHEELLPEAQFLMLLAISAQVGAISAHFSKDKALEVSLLETARSLTAEATEMWKR